MRQLAKLMLAAMVMAFAPLQAAGATRVALVIGNGAYAHTTVLDNPVNDATDIATALKGVGFEVLVAANAEKRQLDRTLRSFADKIAKADVALLFYAGHGVQVGAQNYLVPVDAKLERERDLEFEAIRLDFILRQMELDREGRTSIVILDACRDNPLARNLARSMGTRSTAVGQGLAATTSGIGTFIVYATQPGNVAADGDGRNSPFTAALLRHIGTKGRNLPATMIAVRNDVVAATRGRQVPWDHSSLTGDFYFAGGPSQATAPAGGNAADVAALQERLKRLEEEARKREASAAVPPPAAGKSDQSPPPAVARVQSWQVARERRLEGQRLSAAPSTANCETQCQTNTQCVGYSLSRNGECELFGTVSRITQDARWRSATRPDSPVASAPSPAASAPPLIEPKSTKAPSKLTRDERVRIDGSVIWEGRQRSPEACQDHCDATAGCIGYRHGVKNPVMGQCLLFDRLDRRQEDASWRSGVAGVTAAAPAGTSEPGPPSQRELVEARMPFNTLRGDFERGFVVYSGYAATGDVIKTASADSRQSCGVVCRNTPGCVAALYRRGGRGWNESCVALRSIQTAPVEDREATMLIRH